jgi:ammonia channel protein AmtB
MKIDLIQVLYTVVMVIIAFLGAIIITKTLSKWLKLEPEEENETEEK